MNEKDKLILGTLAGVDLVLSPEHYEEYKGTLKKQLEEKDKEINRLNNIINGFDEWLLGEQMMFYKSNDGERLIRYGETTNKWLKLKELKENNK